MSNDSDNLLIFGNPAPVASYPEYTRMTTPLSLPARYVEFLTTAITTPPPAVPSLTNNLYVRLYTPLYFSDYAPPPAPVGSPNFNVGKIAQVPLLNNPQVTPAGLELYDGSPVTVEKVKGIGPISGFSGTAKDGTLFQLSLTPSNAELPGRVAGRAANPNTTWVFCRADLSMGGKPQFSMSMGFSPEDLLVTLSMYHENVSSSIGLDLAPATGPGGYAKVTRAVTYYGQTVSTVTVNMQDGAIAPVQIATSPLHQFVSTTDLMSSALASVLGEVAGQTQTDPLTALGSLDVQYPETQISYVNRGMALTGPACARLALLLSGSPMPGFPDLAQWIGWSMASLGGPYVRDALTATYTDFEAWRAKQGVGTKYPPYRSPLNDGIGKDIVDAVFDLAWKH
ncbi:hypothetical protein [Rhodanobacter sp. C03]|uniref:hypothetical protein n=1 Tax=Rhodanobacter sp. C03 TaxID=1945858 RepID=UPI0011157FFB|nr:hypothetical protein [Rhodanobacter sp. C03]